MAAAGAWVGMVARSRDALASAAAEVGGHAIPGDVGEPNGVHALATYVTELLGDAPDVLVSCAGAFTLARLADTDPADFERLIAVNLRGPFLLARAFLPFMLRRRAGHLIHVGSVAGRFAFPENGAYSASKFGLRGMHEVLLQELRGTGVRATVVHPGGVKTNIVANARFRADYRGEHADLQSAAADFATIARTSPDKAAQIIHEGIEKQKARIRVGPDAVFLDLLVRLAPTRYFDVLERLEGVVRRGK